MTYQSSCQTCETPAINGSARLGYWKRHTALVANKANRAKTTTVKVNFDNGTSSVVSFRVNRPELTGNVAIDTMRVRIAKAANNANLRRMRDNAETLIERSAINAIINRLESGLAIS